MNKITGLSLCGAAFAVSAASIAFNSPMQWGTFRSNNITTSFIVDSSLVGKQVQLTLTENANGAERSIASKSFPIKELNNEIVFPVSAAVSGGKNYLALKWKVADQEGFIAPFAISPVTAGIDPNAIKVGTLSGEPSASTIKSAGSAVIKAGSAELNFGWNPGSLAMTVRGKGVATISFDVDNSKSGFISFSDRTVTVDFDKKSVSYSFASRRAKENTVLYTSEIWSGDMKGSVVNGEATITLPWYDLGAKPFAGRQIGVVFANGESKYPVAAQEFNPATWGNFLLK